MMSCQIQSASSDSMKLCHILFCHIIPLWSLVATQTDCLFVTGRLLSSISVVRGLIDAF